jgi:hypothetical protein
MAGRPIWCQKLMFFKSRIDYMIYKYSNHQKEISKTVLKGDLVVGTEPTEAKKSFQKSSNNVLSLSNRFLHVLCNFWVHIAYTHLLI